MIDLTELVGWAEDWVHAYGKAAIRSFKPSITIWVSYPIPLPNGSVELVTQPSFQPLNLSLPLSGSGSITVNVMVSHPFRTLLNPGEGAGVAVRGLAKASPEQTTTTTVTTTTITNRTETIICGIGCAVWYLVPHVIAWYPNNESTAPISLAIALAQPSSVSSGVSVDLGILISVASDQVKQFTINGLMIAGAAFEAAMKDAEAGDLFQAISQLSPVLGTTFTFTTKGEVIESNTTEATTSPPDYDDIGQLYMVGQVALVNWTEYVTVWGFGETKPTGNWYLGLQLTEFKAVENNGAVAPVIYSWSAYDPCVNLNEWANEQQVLMQDPGDFFGLGMNSTCPLPNTPAPVIWQDYAAKLTYYTNVSPYNTHFEIYYVDLSVNGGESPLGIGLDAGSAIASIIGTALMTQPETAAAGAVLEVIGALLGAFQYQSNSVAETANYIVIYNHLPYYVSVYYSNLTPAYTVSGQSFTLPKELILINVTS
ncbi:hypothetical protein [Acidilobus sp. 7A]|uniref:hypothetical protein n=1 Tax=Acidilobus sp. 7A TaxID=1577685 RepID=UPI000764E92B|nr:hypothetical protein [Acidilobus sp. 7A]AMD30737.1 hypothetical protein SE86_04840 [Acidilobus sp. 7A]